MKNTLVEFKGARLARDLREVRYGHMETQERRKNPRIDDPHKITVHMVPETSREPFQIVSTPHLADNISQGGLRFRAYGPIPQESFLRIDIAIQGRPEPVSMPGLVRWVATVSNDLRYSAGVEFFELPQDPDREIWAEYVSDRLSVRP